MAKLSDSKTIRAILQLNGTFEIMTQCQVRYNHCWNRQFLLRSTSHYYLKLLWYLRSC